MDPDCHVVSATSAICGVKAEHSRLKPYGPHEESVTSYRSPLRVRNLITDEGDPDGRNVQTGLADWIG
jgi:hypothetical protein